jgi:uncharacterized protein YigA (DUF484 family)
MTRIYDPEFDPLLELEIQRHKIAVLEANFSRLVEAFNNQSHLVRQIAEQNTQLLEQMSKTAQMMKDFPLNT